MYSVHNNSPLVTVRGKISISAPKRDPTELSACNRPTEESRNNVETNSGGDFCKIFKAQKILQEQSHVAEWKRNNHRTRSMQRKKSFTVKWHVDPAKLIFLYMCKMY